MSSKKGREKKGLDKVLYEKLWNTCTMRVFSYVMTLCADRELAEEITQETFYRAWTSEKGAFRGESDALTWLCAIAKNLFYDEQRRLKRQTALPDPGEQASQADLTEKPVIDGEMSFRIHTILHELSEPYREVFELRVFGELSFRQIGQIFQKTETWARVTYHRARLKIQEQLDSGNAGRQTGRS